MKTLFNILGYQAVWFAAVIGAGKGLWWPGTLVAAVFAALHFALCVDGRAARLHDLRLMLVAVVCGIALDGLCAYAGWVDYRGDAVSLPPGGAPLWILSLWAAFALTLRHSLAVPMRRPWLAAAIGAIFGPLAYLAAERGFQSAALGEPRWLALAALALGWAVALWLLSMLIGRHPHPHATQARTAPPYRPDEVDP